MGKLKRHFERHVPYFVTTVTKERAPLFQDRKLSRLLLVTIEYHKTVFDYVVYGYCLMPDHLHIVLMLQGSFTLSFVMKMIKGSFARKANKLRNTEGSLWQSRFYDEAVRSEKQLLRQLDYIHHNPVVAGLVRSAKDYPYSSFHQYQHLPNPDSRLLEIERP